MIEVISVRFRGGCKSYFFDPQGLSVPEGEQVVVETAQGEMCIRDRPRSAAIFTSLPTPV